MRVKEITFQYRNDFSAIMQCEFCSHEWENNAGYNDANYFENVVPNMKCPVCKKCSKDELKDEE